MIDYHSLPGVPHAFWLNFQGIFINTGDELHNVRMGQFVQTDAYLLALCAEVGRLFSPFNLDVTTEPQGVGGCVTVGPKLSDHVLPEALGIGTYSPTSLGFAAVPVNVVAPSVVLDPVELARVVTHEIGHVLGCYHQGKWASDGITWISEYADADAYGYSPIMGSVLQTPVCCWRYGRTDKLPLLGAMQNDVENIAARVGLRIIRGDLNGDGFLSRTRVDAVNGLTDEQAFGMALVNAADYAAAFPDAAITLAWRGDASVDGPFNNFDSTAFGALLAGAAD